jgi:hypothetical protein
MKPLAILTLVAASAAIAADPPPGPPPEIPRKATELMIQMPGRPTPLSAFRGYVCAVAFMSTTCPHCQNLAGVLGPIQQEYASKGVQVLGVVFNPEAITELGNFAHVYAKNMFPIGMSTDPIVAAFLQHPPGMHYIPMMAFIDKQGIIRGEHLGLTDAQFFKEDVVSLNVRSELDRILKEPLIQLPAAKKKSTN